MSNSGSDTRVIYRHANDDPSSTNPFTRVTGPVRQVDMPTPEEMVHGACLLRSGILKALQVHRVSPTDNPIGKTKNMFLTEHAGASARFYGENGPAAHKMDGFTAS
ncbi:UNVERIFIED_CONTAM: hypothetical protein FKN15_060020 [Acipenser sinensis]